MADRYVFTGENLDAINYGWVRWDLRNEQVEYERGAAVVKPEEEK